MENNFLSLIKTRRSVRAYKPHPVPSEALDAVLEAGTYAPTGGGRQSPTIIAITDPKYRQEIARLNAEVMGNNTDPYYGAPVVILVLADGSANTFVEDGSCVLENMMLAAHALGLGTVWVHREREIFDSESGKALLREWKLPETLRGVGGHALLWNLRYADYGGKLSVLRPLYHDFHLFSGHRKSWLQHGNPIMQTDVFPCSIPMVSGQIVPSERDLACISGC